MQSINSEYGSPYLATLHFTFIKLFYVLLRFIFFCSSNGRELRGEQCSLACKEICTETVNSEQSCF